MKVNLICSGEDISNQLGTFASRPWSHFEAAIREVFGLTESDAIEELDVDEEGIQIKIKCLYEIPETGVPQCKAGHWGGSPEHPVRK